MLIARSGDSRGGLSELKALKELTYSWTCRLHPFLPSSTLFNPYVSSVCQKGHVSKTCYHISACSLSLRLFRDRLAKPALVRLIQRQPTLTWPDKICKETDPNKIENRLLKKILTGPFGFCIAEPTDARRQEPEEARAPIPEAATAAMETDNPLPGATLPEYPVPVSPC